MLPGACEAMKSGDVNRMRGPGGGPARVRVCGVMENKEYVG